MSKASERGQRGTVMVLVITILAALLAGLGPGQVDERDGVKWIGTDAWVHVRPSITEPAVRIIAEASTAEAARQLIADIVGAEAHFCP